MRELTQTRSEGKGVPRHSDFQRVACDLQAFDPLCREKVTEVLRDSGEGKAYHIVNGILFFKDQVIIPA